MVVAVLRNESKKAPLNVERLQNIVDHFNGRLAGWYDHANRDYDVNGNGEAKILDSGERFPNGEVIYTIIVKTIENGTTRTVGFNFDLDNATSAPIEWLFNVWMEELMVEINT